MGKPESPIASIVSLLVTSVGTSFMELLLLGGAAFVPTRFYRVTNPWVILIQLISVTVSVSFFQGQRFAAWPGLREWVGHHRGKCLNLLGFFAAIPLNLILFFIYLRLEDLFATILPARCLPYMLMGILSLNFAAGIYGGRYRQSGNISGQKPKKPVVFSLMVWVMLLGWGAALSILIFVFRLNISPRFPQ